MRPEILLTIQKERIVGGAKIWGDVQSPKTYVPDWNVNVRSERTADWMACMWKESIRGRYAAQIC